ncbi:MAG TPA: trimeric intracellular cation channel family protein [Bacillota bacterium]
MRLINGLETLGTIAFAISGALAGNKKKLDFFGVVILSITTAVGGGILRDLLLGIVPPISLRDPYYVTLSVVTAIITFVCDRRLKKFNNILQIFDAIGLGAFTAIGAQIALAYGMESPLLVVSLALSTGTGGGIIRDIFSQEIPLIFKKEIYAVASICGALVYFYSISHSSPEMALYLCFFITFIIRMISIRLNLHLPVAKNI